MTACKARIEIGKTSLLIWTASIGFLLAICVFLFPEMKGQIDNVNNIFSSMGSFTEAFGMDRLNFGTLIVFMPLSAAIFWDSAVHFMRLFCAVGILSKEEKDKTAEFLLTHPVGRKRIVTEKLIAVLIQITALNIIIYALSVGSIAFVGETVPLKEISLLHLAYYLLQLELSGICFGISAFLRKGSAGLGLGIATVMYFLNLIANIADVAAFLKYITPFGYCEGADIVSNGGLDGVMVSVGAVIGIAGIIIAYLKYTKKDIH